MFYLDPMVGAKNVLTRIQHVNLWTNGKIWVNWRILLYALEDWNTGEDPLVKDSLAFKSVRKLRSLIRVSMSIWECVFFG